MTGRRLGLLPFGADNWKLERYAVRSIACMAERRPEGTSPGAKATEDRDPPAQSSIDSSEPDPSHMSNDVIVLGAGMVGVSTALHLQQRGRSVALVDRRGVAEETSYGNAGIIQREGIVPYLFPREWATIL